MRRRTFLLLGLAAAVIAPAQAQPGNAPVIGFLNGGQSDAFAPFVAAFKDGLKDRGYIDGQNVTFEFRWAEGHYDRLPALATELVERKVSLLAATGGTAAVRAALTTTNTIPIVFTSGDPVGERLVESVGRPGGNATGVDILTTALMPKRLELLRDLLPAASRVALLVNPSKSATAREVREVNNAVTAAGLALLVYEARSAAEIDAAFAALAAARPDALIVGADPYFSGQREQFVALSAHHRLPTVYEWSEFVKAGGLISYGPSLRGAYRQAGSYAGQILDGMKPGELPVQQPTTFELAINMRAAHALGLTVPAAVLARADEVIE